MANSQCTSCGLIHQDGQCRMYMSVDVTPAFCCTIYLNTVGLLFLLFLFCIGLTKLHVKSHICYVELFANSVSISKANANVCDADWRISFVARSPVTDCKISLHTLKSRLLRGDEVISNSSSPSSGYFGQVVAGDKTNVLFEKVVMPEVIGDVIWDFRVEIVSAVNTNAGDVTVFMMAACPDIPVKFTTDPAGNVMGSWLGNMRRCDCIFRPNLASFSPIMMNLAMISISWL